MMQFIYHHVYFSVFVGIIFTGDTGLLAGAFLITKGLISPTAIIILGATASFLGNLFYYYLGKFLFNRVNFLREKMSRKIDNSLGIVKKFGNPTLLFSRFLYGIRNIIPVTLGISKSNLLLFLIFNFIGALFWSVIITYLGIIYSSAAFKVLNEIKNIGYTVIIAISGILIFYAAIRFIVKKLSLHLRNDL